MKGTSRVLVVDDDAGIREMIDMALSAEGYEVRTAADGALALEAAREWPPDVILLDLKMPVMTGWEFAERYRAAPGPHAPLIVFTATALDGQRQASRLEADAYLGKPFELARLLELLEQHTTRA